MGNPSEITVAEIQAMLAGNMAGLVDRLGARGKPSGRGHVLRYGKKGSLIVQRSGPKAGAWFDFEAGVGGGPLKFIEHENGCSFVEAISWARDYLGLESFNDEQRRRWQSQAAARAVARAEDEVRGAATDAATVEIARALWRASLPIGGTLAEKYLIETRKIPRPAWGWPESIRHYSGPDGRGLIIGATDDAGTIHAVQRTFLTDRAEKIGGEYGKMSDGRPDVPVAVRFAAAPGAGDVLQIAEGLETGLTLWAATGFETWVCRGGLQTAPITGPRTILAAICKIAPNNDPTFYSVQHIAAIA